MEQNGYLQFRAETDREYLAANIGIIARFWISEAVISYRGRSVEEQIHYHLSLIAHLLQPYAVGAGREQLQAFFRD